MSLKMKLTSTICAFFLILGLVITGVFAVPQATVNLGGTLTFNATDIYAKVSGTITGSKEDPQLETVEFNAGSASDTSTWTKNLAFDDEGSTIKILIKIENLATDRAMYANIALADDMSSQVSSTMTRLESETDLEGEPYAAGGLITLEQADGESNNVAYIELRIDIKDKNTSLTADSKWGYVISLNKDSLVEGKQNTSDIVNYTKTQYNTMQVSGEFGAQADSLTELTILDYIDVNGVDYAVTSTAYQALIGGHVIETLNLPTTLTLIGKESFTDYYALEEINIPEGVLVIDEGAFTYGYGTKRINISSTVREIKGIVPIRSTVVESITVAQGNDYYEDRGMNAIIEKSTDTLILGCKNTVMNNTIKAIGDYAFDSADLESVIIPDSVITIGNYAFSNTLLLENITIGSGVKSIGENAFGGVEKLKTITIPDNVEVLGDYLFSSSMALERVNIGKGIKQIGLALFSDIDPVPEVYYAGSETEWNSIQGLADAEIPVAKVHFNSSF